MSESSEPGRLRVGVVGLGTIAQTMHLPNLALLRDRYEVAALCDLSERALGFGSDLFPTATTTREWRHLLALDLDAVLVLTPGSHAPIALAAIQAGLHVFAEKPLCFSVTEGHELVAAAEAARVVLMVGYMKRYDPAYERLAEELAAWPERPRLVRVTTLEAPWQPYLAHVPRVAGDDVAPEVLAGLRADDEQRVAAAIGTDDPVLRRAYRFWLLDSMVHEFNAVRCLFGEPTELCFAHVWGDAIGVTVTLAFGPETECIVMWADLPGLTRYAQEFAVYAPDRRAVLGFPSPYLRNAPTSLALEGGVPGEIESWRTEHTVSYDEAFIRELVEFHGAVTEGRAPRTSGTDGLADIALCQAVVAACVEGGPIERPTSTEAAD